MHGWLELASYSPFNSLLYGTLTAFSFWGVGHVVCGRIIRSVPEFLRLPTELVTGVLVTSLVVEALAMCDLSYVGAMRVLWFVALLPAVVSLIRLASNRAAHPIGPEQRVAATWYWVLAGLMGAALLLAAVAPASRSDEMSYHALASARLLTDGGLRFYPLPWEASVLPQFAWHFALVPLYAISGSAAAGVASAWFALALARSVGRLVQWQTTSAPLGAVASFVALAGGYTVVFFSTTGPHAFGYLSVFVAVSAVGWSREIRNAAGPFAYAFTVAAGCAGAVAGKITMLPVAALITFLAAWDILQETPEPRRRALSLGFLVLVPAIAVGPLLLWTWSVAGSPLGALTAKLNQAAPPDPEALGAYEGTRELFANNFQWKFEAAYWSLPLALCALVALVLETSRQRRTRWWLIAGCQTLVIVLLLPKEIRHLGGIQYPLLASGIAALASQAAARGYSYGRLAAVTAATAAPWAMFVLWLATIYVPLTTGRMSAPQFLRQYSGLQSDYEALNRILPSGARILMGRSRSDAQQSGWYARPPIYYAPRPVLFHTSQVHAQDHVYLMYIGAGAQGTHGPIPLDPWLPSGYSLGREVYSNPQARFYPSRTPGGNAGLARLDVLELVRDP